MFRNLSIQQNATNKTYCEKPNENIFEEHHMIPKDHIVTFFEDRCILRDKQLDENKSSGIYNKNIYWVSQSYNQKALRPSSVF